MGSDEKFLGEGNCSVEVEPDAVPMLERIENLLALPAAPRFFMHAGRGYEMTGTGKPELGFILAGRAPELMGERPGSAVAWVEWWASPCGTAPAAERCVTVLFRVDGWKLAPFHVGFGDHSAVVGEVGAE